MMFVYVFVGGAACVAIGWLGARGILQERRWGNWIMVGGFGIVWPLTVILAYPPPSDVGIWRAGLVAGGLGAAYGSLLTLALRSDRVRQLIETVRGVR